MKITGQNNLLYALDTLGTKATGFAVSKIGTGINCKEASNVTGFTITSTQPSGTDIRLAFADGTSWFTLNTSGGIVTLSSSEPDYDLVASKGNTVEQLKALTSIPAFVGKLIRVAIALSTTAPSTSIPQIKLAVKASSQNTVTELVEYSPIYELGEGATVSSMSFNKTVTGGGTVRVQGKLFREDGSESDWLTEETIRGVSGTGLQLRTILFVPTVGSGSAKMTGVECKCVSGSGTSSAGTGKVYLNTEDWVLPVKTCRVTVRHSPLTENTMTVYAAFRKTPKLSLNERLGVASGARQSFNLKFKDGIKADTFRLYSDGQELLTGFELNGRIGRVTLTGTEGCIITCSYQYNWELETWQKMTLEGTYSLEDYDESMYALEVSGEHTAGSIMIETTCQSGHISGQSLGIATGRAQTVLLNKRVSGNLYVESGSTQWDSSTGHYKNAYQVNSKNYTLLGDSRLLRFAVPAGELVRAAYDWEAEPVKLYQVTAVFSE